MMIPRIQPLPVELIDMIIDYVEVDVMSLDPESKRRTHNCQVRGCDDPDINHDVNLLKFSHICSSFRERAMPRLWSNYVVSTDRFSKTELLLKLAEDKSIYTKHVKQLFIAGSGTSSWDDLSSCVWKDERKPFGVHVQTLPRADYHYAESLIIRKCIQNVIHGKIRYIEFLYEPSIQLISDPRLFLFWLFVSNPKANSICSNTFETFWATAKRIYEDNKEVWNKITTANSIDAELLQYIDMYRPSTLKPRKDHFHWESVWNQFCCMSQYHHLLEDFIKLLKNDFDFRITKAFKDKSQLSVPYWLRETNPTTEDGNGRSVFEVLKKFINSRSASFKHGDYWITPELVKSWRLHNHSRRAGYVQEASWALCSDHRLRKQVALFHKNGWKDPGNANASNGCGQTVDDEDDGCITM